MFDEHYIPCLKTFQPFAVDNGMSNQVIENTFVQMANTELKGQQLDQKTKFEKAQQLKKDIIIAQFLNQDFAS